MHIFGVKTQAWGWVLIWRKLVMANWAICRWHLNRSVTYLPINDLHSWRSTPGSFPLQELICKFQGLAWNQMWWDVGEIMTNQLGFEPRPPESQFRYSTNCYWCWNLNQFDRLNITSQTGYHNYLLNTENIRLWTNIP